MAPGDGVEMSDELRAAMQTAVTRTAYFVTMVRRAIGTIELEVARGDDSRSALLPPLRALVQQHVEMIAELVDATRNPALDQERLAALVRELQALQFNGPRWLVDG